MSRSRSLRLWLCCLGRQLSALLLPLAEVCLRRIHRRKFHVLLHLPLLPLLHSFHPHLLHHALRHGRGHALLLWLLARDTSMLEW